MKSRWTLEKSCRALNFTLKFDLIQNVEAIILNYQFYISQNWAVKSDTILRDSNFNFGFYKFCDSDTETK